MTTDFTMKISHLSQGSIVLLAATGWLIALTVLAAAVNPCLERWLEVHLLP